MILDETAHIAAMTDYAHPPATIRLEISGGASASGSAPCGCPAPRIVGRAGGPRCQARAVLQARGRPVVRHHAGSTRPWVLRPARREPADRRGAASVSEERPRQSLQLGGKRTPDKGWARVLAARRSCARACEHDLRELQRDVLDVVHSALHRSGRRCRSSNRSTR